MMEAKTKEPKFQIGDIVSRRFKNGNTETKEISKVLFINHDHIITTDVIYYGIFGYKPNNGSGIQLIAEDELTLVRKWNESVPSEQVKQSKVKSQPTYLFEMLTDKSIETVELAVKLIKGLTSADIVEVYQDNHGVVVTQNFVNKLCEFVNTKRHMVDRDIKFDGSDFWENLERLNPQCFLDYTVERIIMEELKRRTLANE